MCCRFLLTLCKLLAVILNEVARHVAGATTSEHTVGICAMHTVYNLTGAHVTPDGLYLGANEDDCLEDFIGWTKQHCLALP